MAVTVCTMESCEEVQRLAGRKRLLIIRGPGWPWFENVCTLRVCLINISATTGKIVTNTACGIYIIYGQNAL